MGSIPENGLYHEKVVVKRIIEDGFSSLDYGANVLPGVNPKVENNFPNIRKIF